MNTPYIGKIRLIKQPDLAIKRYDQSGNYFYTERTSQPSKLQQFDGKDWVDVEIIEEQL